MRFKNLKLFPDAVLIITTVVKGPVKCLKQTSTLILKTTENLKIKKKKAQSCR